MQHFLTMALIGALFSKALMEFKSEFQDGYKEEYVEGVYHLILLACAIGATSWR